MSKAHYDADLPARSGMGSSSAFAVGLLHAAHRYLGRPATALQLAQNAIHLERNVLGEHGGQPRPGRGGARGLGIASISELTIPFK